MGDEKGAWVPIGIATTIPSIWGKKSSGTLRRWCQDYLDSGKRPHAGFRCRKNKKGYEIFMPGFDDDYSGLHRYSAELRVQIPIGLISHYLKFKNSQTQRNLFQFWFVNQINALSQNSLITLKIIQKPALAKKLSLSYGIYGKARKISRQFNIPVVTLATNLFIEWVLSNNSQTEKEAYDGTETCCSINAN